MKKLLLIFLVLILLAPASLAVQLGQGLGDKFNSVSIGTTEVVSNISTGIYIPTHAWTTNVAASTPYPMSWMRVGNVVTVMFKANIDTTLGVGAASDLDFDLPVICTSVPTLCGSAAFESNPTEAGIIVAADNKQARLSWRSFDASNVTWGGMFQYVVN